jgi:uncharacterized protein YciW
MGHVKYLSAVADAPASHVYNLENEVGLDPRRAAAFAFARKLTRTPEKIERADVDALRGRFTDPEIVQLVFAICHFNTMNRLADAFGVPLERTNVFAGPDKPKAGTPGVSPPPAPAPRP